QYEPAFREHAVDAEVLPELTAEDLKEIGIAAAGHRRKLLTAIARLKSDADGEPSRAPSSAPSPAPLPEPAAASETAAGERRNVAVLFADLVGYTRLTGEIGAEATHALLNAFFAEVDAVVARSGGRVDKHIGDCVMAVFGAPVAHGNDAERAVRAAIDIRAAIEGLSAARDNEIAVHCGVAMGSVVASYLGAGDTAEYAVTGESVNLASRLTDAAGAGEVLISDGLYRALADKLDCEPVGDLTVKGFAEAIPAWRLERLREARAESSRFVGRRTQLRQFDSLLQACLEDGAGHLVQLRGEAGIGKTRLSEEFERMALAADFACHRALVLDFGVETGRDAIRVLLRDLLGVDPRSDGAALQTAARDAVERGVVAPEYEAHLNDLLDAPQPEPLRALYNAMDVERRAEGRGAVIAQVAQHAAAERPRLLIVEDVHWARPPLLRNIAHLARAIEECRAILVVTTRVEGDPLDRAWRATLGGTPVTTVDLSPLRAEEARRICENAIDDPGLIARFIERAGGNPLFLEQLLRHSHEQAGAGVPGTIQSLVQATVDQLSAADKQAVQAASVIGQQIDPELLQFLSDGRELEPARLVETNLLRPHGQVFLFVHALVRDAVYESLLSSARKRLHRRAATWFEGRDSRLHAEHLALAEAPEAPAAFLAAAREERAKYHYETALGLIERGLALAATPEEQIALRLLMGDTLHDFGRMTEAEAAYQAALDAAPGPAQRCRALIGLAGVKRVTEDIDGALLDLERAETDAVAEGLLAERSRIHFLRGNLLFPRGDQEGCLRAHQAGLEFARRAGRPDLEAASLGGLGDAEYQRGRMVSSCERLEACIKLAREQGLGRIEVANHAQIAHALSYAATHQEACEAARAAIEAAVRVGHARAEINALGALASALLGLARYEECLEATDRLDDRIERLGALRFLQHSILLRGRALHGLGRTDEAIARLRDGLAQAEEGGFAFRGPALVSGLAVVAEDAAEKRASMERADRGIAQGCVGHNQFRVYADGIDVAFALGDAAMLRRYIELMEGYPPDETVAWSVAHAERGRALLAQLEQGDTPEAVELMRAADRRLAELGLHYCRLLPAEA
ncbi:MAG TPA: adenylate/guanylate cyclase domain-containing protein, partial [Kiloniellales bacterium]|nr:adenylate/guanylate cyclase domain-containing protein [Kiloniellales bacterium]